MPQRIPPGTFLAISTAVNKVPKSASSAPMPTVWKEPSIKAARKGYSPTSVGPSTTILAFCRPMKAINKPIPLVTPYFSAGGMQLKIASRTLVRDKIIKIIPSTNTAASAICQEYPICATTVKAKKAFSPMPGASTKG